jgi:hypothetical protein
MGGGVYVLLSLNYSQLFREYYVYLMVGGIREIRAMS